jgi:hypothetical protein
MLSFQGQLARDTAWKTAAAGTRASSVVDVGVGVVDEDAGLHVAAGVDVAEHAAAGDAAADELAVVLEVHGHDGLAALVVAHLADAVIMYSRCSMVGMRSALAPSPTGM